MSGPFEPFELERVTRQDDGRYVLLYTWPAESAEHEATVRVPESGPDAPAAAHDASAGPAEPWSPEAEPVSRSEDAPVEGADPTERDV